MFKKIIPGIIILLVVVGYFTWNNNLKPVNPRDHTEKMFVIRPGSGISTISKNLEREGLIKNALFFRIYIQQSGLHKKIQAGDFRISPSMDSKKIAEILTTGTIDVWVTIPEGMRSEEIAQILSNKMTNYDDSWISELKKYEGELFPDTYLIPKDATIDSVINLLTSTFDAKYNSILKKDSPYSKNQLIIIASLIEREAKHDSDRAIISSVIHNRLKIGMALQIDATIQYAKGYSDGKWWSPISLEEYRSVKSTYNTYLQPGLPPSPICNPGLEAMIAAANPDTTQYLYYITDKNGINRYAETIEEHEKNKQRYGLSN
ncbi:MAG: endolytic transglycosylase MltG [Candidatus Levybacteria bacterium]|nr:endolytic transglycosylase MltG [Candidatus Levybacteria bacterium]